MSEETKLVLVKRVPASPERVYEAFVRPEVMKQWFCPGNMAVPVAEADARVGGGYRVDMHDPDDGETYTVRGEFRELVPSERLVQTWRWDHAESETLVTVEFRPIGDGHTEITLTHERFPDASVRDNHQDGWSSALDNLARAFKITA